MKAALFLCLLLAACGGGGGDQPEASVEVDAPVVRHASINPQSPPPAVGAE